MVQAGTRDARTPAPEPAVAFEKQKMLPPQAQQFVQHHTRAGQLRRIPEYPLRIQFPRGHGSGLQAFAVVQQSPQSQIWASQRLASGELEFPDARSLVRRCPFHRNRGQCRAARPVWKAGDSHRNHFPTGPECLPAGSQTAGQLSRNQVPGGRSWPGLPPAPYGTGQIGRATRQARRAVRTGLRAGKRSRPEA